MESSNVPANPGPVADRISIWPLDDGSYGLDATFQGASGYERAEWHTKGLDERQTPFSFRQELDGGWTIRFGPLSATTVGVALSSFVS
jgi:hypothetical protein